MGVIIPTLDAGRPTLLSLSKAGTTSLTVPAGRMYRFEWLGMTYVASADVANRLCLLRLTLVNTQVLYLAGMGTITASQTKAASLNLLGNVTTAGPNAVDQGTSGKVFTLYPAHQIDLVVTNGQAADAWYIEGLYYDCPLYVP